jgi:type I restriction enzyme M protein
MQNGWDAGLIPDSYLIEEFFQAEQAEIEALEIQQSEKETLLEEAVEEAIGLLELEAEEDETISTAKVKEELKAQIEYYTTEKQKPQEAKPYEEAEKKIVAVEKEIKELKAVLKVKQAELDLKLVLKRYGSEDEKAESKKLLQTANAEIAKLDNIIDELIAGFRADFKKAEDFDQIKKSTADLEKLLKKDKENSAETLQKLAKVMEAKKQFKEITKGYNALLKDKQIILDKLNKLDDLLENIGGIISTKEAQKLILKKHFDIINQQLQRYLNAEKRTLIAAYEKLYDKYFVSARQIELNRNETMNSLNDFLTQLNYLN